MPPFDVQLHGQTTSDIRSVAFLDSFLAELRLLFPTDDVFVEWTTSGTHRLTRVPYASLDVEQKQQLVGGGVLGFAISPVAGS